MRDALLLIFGAELVLPTTQPPPAGTLELQSRIDALRMLATSNNAELPHCANHEGKVDAAVHQLWASLRREVIPQC